MYRSGPLRPPQLRVHTGFLRQINKKFTFVGYLVALVPAIILPYYSVIGGWVLKYLAAFVSGGGKSAAVDGYFGGFVGTVGEPIVWFTIFLGVTMLVLVFGVDKGIERASKIMMPILFILTIVVAGYALTIDGALEGVKYYLIPNLEHFSIKTVIAAMGQLFYSMSLAMGIMITYGSYMKKDVNIEKSVHQIEIFDTGFAILAGLMIVPAAYVFTGGEVGQGPSLMFSTLPKVFEQMLGGQIIGALFFVLVLFAALTSSISLAETVVSIISLNKLLTKHLKEQLLL